MEVYTREDERTELKDARKESDGMSEFFSPPVRSRQKAANVTTHSAMLTIKKSSIPKQVGIKSVLSSLEPPATEESNVKSKKFSLVPFARE